MAAELPALLILGVVLLFWYNSARIREQARKNILAHCRARGLTLLDDTVVLQGMTLRRNAAGRIVIARRYRFEFSSDGALRYRGRVAMLDQLVEQIDLEPWRLPDEQ